MFSILNNLKKNKYFFLFSFILINFFCKYCLKLFERQVITFFFQINCLFFEHFDLEKVADGSFDFSGLIPEILPATVTLISMLGWLYFYKTLAEYFITYPMDTPFYTPQPTSFMEDLADEENLESSNLDDILYIRTDPWISVPENNSDVDDSISEDLVSDSGLLPATYSILEYILPHSTEDLMFKSVILYVIVEGFVIYSKVALSYQYC